MKDRFDLEQEIMECWHVTSDIDMLFESVLDSPTPMTHDEIANALLGLKVIYNLRFEKLEDTFTQAFKLNQYRETIKYPFATGDYEDGDW